MAYFKTVSIPLGNSLNIVTDAFTSGSYTRLGNPGGTKYTPTALAGSADVTIGPFNEVRDYVFNVTNQEGLATTLAFSGVYTADDGTDVSLLAPKASPTFTGTVTLPATTSIGTVTNTELSYLDGVTSAIQTQLGARALTGATVITPLDNDADGTEIATAVNGIITALIAAGVLAAA